MSGSRVVAMHASAAPASLPCPRATCVTTSLPSCAGHWQSRCFACMTGAPGLFEVTRYAASSHFFPFAVISL
jgi:hypothetical protein